MRRRRAPLYAAPERVCSVIRGAEISVKLAVCCTRIRESGSGQPVAETLLNHAVMKDSFPDYAQG
jgi:hypothetical protein